MRERFGSGYLSIDSSWVLGSAQINEKTPFRCSAAAEQGNVEFNDFLARVIPKGVVKLESKQHQIRISHRETLNIVGKLKLPSCYGVTDKRPKNDLNTPRRPEREGMMKRGTQKEPEEACYGWSLSASRTPTNARKFRARSLQVRAINTWTVGGWRTLIGT